MPSTTSRQRELLAFVGRGGIFARRAVDQPWQLQKEGARRASWISDAGLEALHRQGWIDGGGGLGNLLKFAPLLTDLGRDALGEPRQAEAPPPPATAESIDADIERRRRIGLSNAAIALATGMTSCRILHVLDDRIPDAPIPCVSERSIDPRAIDAEAPPAEDEPVNSGELWNEDERAELRIAVDAVVARRGAYRPNKRMLLPVRRLAAGLGRTPAAVRMKALPMLKRSAKPSTSEESTS